MGIKKVASEALEGLVAHWITAAIVALLTLGLSYWGRMREGWSWPIVGTTAVLLFAACLSEYRYWPIRRYARDANLSLRIHADELGIRTFA
jgi:hypothetical protein